MESKPQTVKIHELRFASSIKKWKAARPGTDAVEIAIHAVLFQENDKFLVQCLEYDILAQGDTIEEAKENIRHTVLAEFEYTDKPDSILPFEGIAPAPQKFWDRWKDTKKENKLVGNLFVIPTPTFDSGHSCFMLEFISFGDEN